MNRGASLKRCMLGALAPVVAPQLSTALGGDSFGTLSYGYATGLAPIVMEGGALPLEVGAIAGTTDTLGLATLPALWSLWSDSESETKSESIPPAQENA